MLLCVLQQIDQITREHIVLLILNTNHLNVLFSLYHQYSQRRNLNSLPLTSPQLIPSPLKTIALPVLISLQKLRSQDLLTNLLTLLRNESL